MRRIFLCLVLLVCDLAAHAANILTNPGFEADSSATNIVGWMTYGANTYNETGATAHSGTNYFKVYQAFNGAVNRNGIFQDNISAPGVVFSANAGLTLFRVTK